MILHTIWGTPRKLGLPDLSRGISAEKLADDDLLALTRTLSC